MIITFMSDFGTEDGYVGSVKGVLLGKAPKATLVDITHAIPPFDVGRGAYTLLNYYDSFPPGTIHLAVVDPGVGSARKALILKLRDYYLVGPDNGLFSFVLQRETFSAYEINARVVNPELAHATFHARDLFGPAAAMLANGASPGRIGIPLKQIELQQPAFWERQGNLLKLKIIAVDHFGNIVTALHRDDLNRLKKTINVVRFKNFKTNHVHNYYAEVEKGKPLVLWNSLNFLEIAVCEGSAADYFKADINKDRITVELRDLD